MPRYRFLPRGTSRTFYLPNMSIGQDLFHVCRYWAAGCSVSVTSAATHRVHYLPAVDLSTAGIEPTSRRADFSPPWTLHENKQDERNVYKYCSTSIPKVRPTKYWRHKNETVCSWQIGMIVLCWNHCNSSKWTGSAKIFNDTLSCTSNGRLHLFWKTWFQLPQHQRGYYDCTWWSLQ